MKTILKLLLGFFTIWPLIYLPLFIISIFSFIIIPKNIVDNMFMIIFPLHFLTMLIIFGLLGFYFLHAYKYLTRTKKEHWMKMMFFAGFILFPIYWYKFIWKEEK